MLKYLVLFLALLQADIAVADINANGQVKNMQLEKLSSAPTASEARTYYNTTSKKPEIYNGTAWVGLGGGGSGEGGENFIENGRAEDVTIVGISRYDDGASATPVDCTGGAPSAVSAATRNTSNPISETADYVFAKSAANGQGEGWAIDVTIPANNPAAVSGWNAQLAALLRVVSGSYDAGDIGVFVYDVTNALMSSELHEVADSSQTYPWSGNFTTSGTSTSYRVCLHVTTTNASAWTVGADNFYAGIEKNGPVTAMPYADSVVWNDGGSWVSNTTYTGTYWRRGNLFSGQKLVSVTGTPTTATLTINMPTGLTIKESEMNTASVKIVGTARVFDASGSPRITAFVGYVPGSNTSLTLVYPNQNSNTDTELNRMPVVTQAAPLTFAIGDYLDITVTGPIPIEEWSSPSYASPGSSCEYAATSGTWDADSTTTVKGMSGQPIGGALTAARSKTVTFSNPIRFARVLLSRNRTAFFPAVGASIGPSGGTTVTLSRNAAGSLIAGAALRVSLTDQKVADVIFAQYASIASDDAPTNDWPSSDAYWVVENCPTAQGSIVYALAGEDTPGLISSENEGTCTPTLTGSGGAFSSVTYVSQGCRWTRLGNRYFVDVSVVWSAATGGTGNLRIAGIPTGAAVPDSVRCANNFSRIDLSAGYTYIYTTVAGATGEIGVAEAGDNVVAQSVGVAAATGGSFNKTLGVSCNYEVSL